MLHFELAPSLAIKQPDSLPHCHAAQDSPIPPTVELLLSTLYRHLAGDLRNIMLSFLGTTNTHALNLSSNNLNLKFKQLEGFLNSSSRDFSINFEFPSHHRMDKGHNPWHVFSFHFILSNSSYYCNHSRFTLRISVIRTSPETVSL